MYKYISIFSTSFLACLFIFIIDNDGSLFGFKILLVFACAEIIYYSKNIFRILKKNVHSPEKVERSNHKMGGKYELPACNDVIVDELMKIKSSLADIRAFQIINRKDRHSFWKVPECFIAKYLLYFDYP